MKNSTKDHLTEVEKNIIYGTPLKENEKPLKDKKKNLNVKSWLPKKLPKPNNNGLPEGFL